MKPLGIRKFRLLGLAALILVAAATSLVVLQRPSGTPTAALAAPDSVAAESTGARNREASPAKAKKKGKGEKKEEPPVPVEVAVAGPRDLPATFAATGSLEAKRQVELVAKAGGQVVKLGVEEGQFVRAGDVLLEIEHREEALLVEQNRVRAETARRELDRIQGLTEKGLGSDRDLEAQKELAQVSELEHHLAEVRLDDKVVRAPFGGQVTRREVEIGQTVNAGQPLLEIADVSPLELKLYLPEKLVGRLAVGQTVDLFSDVDPSLRLTGVVGRIAPAVDPATSTVKVTLHVDAAGGPVRVGSFVRARITTDVRRGAVAVPKKSLVPEAGVTYLYLAEADTVRKIPVTTGYTDESFTEIVSGIAAGDRVVCVGQGGLRHGSKIRLLAAAAGTEGNPAPATSESGGDR